VSDLPTIPTLSTFAPHVGGTFRLHVAPEHVQDVELVEARRLSNTPAGAGREPFALVFKGPGGAPRLPQQIYRFEHDSVAHDIFIVPIGLDNGRLLYEAIFT
jgi:hypothetical protein